MDSLDSFFSAHRPRWAQALIYIVVCIGFLKITQILIEVLAFLNRHILRPLKQCGSNRFMLKYGGVMGETWVLVSGGSDGIGLEMCLKLAA